MSEFQQYPIAPPMASRGWNANTLWQQPGWLIRTDDAVLDEFAQLCAHTTVHAERLSSYQRGQFALPRLEQFASWVRFQLLDGAGATWITGLSRSRFGELEQSLFYLILGMAMDQPMGQYGRLYEVRDQGDSYRDMSISVSQAREETNFHTDSSARDSLPDLVGLLCLQTARSGGETLISNAVAAHEILREHQPETLQLLYREYIRDIVTPSSGRALEQFIENRFPVFSYGLYHSGLTFRYMRYWIETGHKRAGLPLEPECVEAMNQLDAVLGSERQVVRFRLQAGDMLWVNNHIIAHNRTGYEDDPQRPRRLLRMWIKVTRD